MISSPDSKERMAGTLESAFPAGASPTTATGQRVTRLRPCSCANLDASFSSNTLETGYPCGGADDHGAPSANGHEVGKGAKLMN